MTLVVLFSTACQKTDKDSGRPQAYQNDILMFKNSSEFKDVAEIVLISSREEAPALLKSQFNFTSFAEEADEFYENIDIEAFSTTEEAVAFVNNNRQYLHVFYDEDGEMHVEPLLSNNFMRAFINEDRLFMIGDSIFRVFEEMTLGTMAGNYLIFVGSDESDIPQLLDNEEVFTMYSHRMDITLKDPGHNCGVHRATIAQAGNERIRLDVNVVYLHVLGGTYQWTFFSARPFRRAGIWWNVSRTISCDINVATGYFVYNNVNNWIRKIGTFSTSGTFTRNLNGILTEEWICIGYHCVPMAHIDGINSWATQPATHKAIITCNSHLLP